MVSLPSPCPSLVLDLQIYCEVIQSQENPKPSLEVDTLPDSGYVHFLPCSW